MAAISDTYSDFFADNQANWDDRAHIHMASDMYGVEHLISTPGHVDNTVALDRQRLGDLSHCDVVHLMCHIGTDTLSLARLGARSVTGVDLSGESITYASQIAQRAGIDIRYVQANVFDAVEALEAYTDEERYDLVYTGIGALGWLPVLDEWAQVVAGLLRPGGRFFIREDHPSSMMLADELADNSACVGYDYFNTGVLTDEEEGTYTDTPEGISEIIHRRNHWWNHSLDAIIMALIRAGLQIESFEEYDYSMWPRFGDKSIKIAPGQYGLPQGTFRIPLTFTLSARKPV